MGRSVSVPALAQIVAYASITEFDLDAFDLALDHYQDQLRSAFPSIVPVRMVRHPDYTVVGDNRHATFGISEYCGLVAYWAIPQTELGKAWLNQIEPAFVEMFGQLEKLGTASNGEAFYRRMK